MIGRARRIVRYPALYLALYLAPYLALTAAASPGGGRPDAATLLRRADLVRNPYLGTALDLELSVVSRARLAEGPARELRSSRFTLLTHRSGRTLMLMLGEEPAAPGALLIADGVYWLLLPGAERPVDLAFRHVVAGDLSHAGFLRFELRRHYQPRHDGEETVDGVPCWRLELEPEDRNAPFGRVRYWIAKDGFLPIRIEFFSPAGGLLKSVRFTRYQDTAVGARPARIEIEDALRPGERAVLALGKPVGVHTTPLAFDLDDLAMLREAASRLAAEGETPVPARRLVAALAAGARARELPR